MLRILPYQEKYLSALAEFSERSFRDTYTAYNTAEDMDRYVEEHFTAPRWQQQLEQAGHEAILLCEADTVRGYIHYRETLTPAPEAGTPAIQVERLYIDATLKGGGYGKKLLRAVEGAAAMARRRIVFLGVWEKNEAAMAFYQHMGYAPFGEYIFMLGEDKQRDFWLKKRLMP